MDLTETFIGFCTGIIAAVIPKSFRSKKESDELLIALVKTLQGEVERMHKELEIVRKEYDLKLKNVQTEYGELLTKYNQLKKDFQDYKAKNK